MAAIGRARDALLGLLVAPRNAKVAEQGEGGVVFSYAAMPEFSNKLLRHVCEDKSTLRNGSNGGRTYIEPGPRRSAGRPRSSWGPCEEGERRDLSVGLLVRLRVLRANPFEPSCHPRSLGRCVRDQQSPCPRDRRPSGLDQDAECSQQRDGH